MQCYWFGDPSQAFFSLSHSSTRDQDIRVEPDAQAVARADRGRGQPVRGCSGATTICIEKPDLRRVKSGNRGDVPQIPAKCQKQSRPRQRSVGTCSIEATYAPEQAQILAEHSRSLSGTRPTARCSACTRAEPSRLDPIALGGFAGRRTTIRCRKRLWPFGWPRGASRQSPIEALRSLTLQAKRRLQQMV